MKFSRVEGSTIIQTLALRVEQTPAAVAYRYPSEKGGVIALTWAEHWRAVCAVAISMKEHGIGKGSRVASMLGSSWLGEVIDKAVLLAGASVVGIEPNSPQETALTLVEATNASFIVCGEFENIEALSSSLKPQTKISFAIADSLHWPDGSITNVRDSGPASNVMKFEWTFPEPDDEAVVVFTSGTGGDRKGVPYSHAQLAAASSAILKTLGTAIGPKDQSISWLPLANLFQKIVNSCATQCGASTYFVENPLRILSEVRVAKPSIMIGVPRFFQKIHHNAEMAASRDQKSLLTVISTFLSNNSPLFRRIIMTRLIGQGIKRAFGGKIRCFISGSAPLSMETLRFFESVGLPIYEAYGLSENVVPIAMNSPTDFKFGSVGKPLCSQKVRISPEGEVLVKGKGVFSGYLNSASTESFTKEGELRTGDEGYFDEEGFLYLTGRISAQIKTSTGRKVSPEQIEKILIESSYFENVIVIGEGQKALGALVALNLEAVQNYMKTHGYQVIKETSALVHSPIVRWLVGFELDRLSTELPEYQRIATFAIIPDRPTQANQLMTPSLKIRRKAVEENYRDIITAMFQGLGESPIVGDHQTRKICRL